ncbi:MAG TPA: hypothetical protein VFJ72_06355 [Rubrobacteraceae bacterium]|nr:hypothetical protein [Rubrobacteraceae bacterium]
MTALNSASATASLGSRGRAPAQRRSEDIALTDASVTAQVNINTHEPNSLFAFHAG